MIRRKSGIACRQRGARDGSDLRLALSLAICVACSGSDSWAENVETRHPVFPPDYGIEQIEQLVSGKLEPANRTHSIWALGIHEDPSRLGIEDAMALTPEDLADLVPRTKGVYFCGCPACDGGSQENLVLRWRYGMEDEVVCVYCETRFPNDRFPHNRERVIIAPDGSSQVYRWHEDAKGREYFFEARAWYDRGVWAQTMAHRLANLYALTGEIAFAERAAAIVGRFAEHFPNYAITVDLPFRPLQFFPADQKWPYEGVAPFRGSKLYYWAYADVPDVLAKAYDLVAASDAFERLGAMFAPGIQGRIENDLIRLAYEFTAANPDNLSNMAPGMYHDMIVAGRIVGDMEMVLEPVRRLDEFMEANFYFDGWWKEGTTGYHTQTVNGLNDVARVVAGFRVPPERIDHATRP